MRRPGSFPAALLTLLLAVAPLACGGDDVLSPPDGAACTRGSLAAGEVRDGEVTDEGCLMYSAYNNWETYAESWTLRLKPNTAYVVRLRPADPDDDDFMGELVAYARSASGDAMFATAAAFSFGEDDRSREMFLVTDRERTLSVRVEVPDYYGTYGAYELEVEGCPVTAFTDGNDDQAIDGIDVAAGCRSMGFDDRHESRVRFVAFPARPDRAYEVGAERTNGDAPLLMRLLGPDLDLAATTDGSIWRSSPPDVSQHVFDYYLPRSGRYVLAIGMRHDGDATVRAELEQGPVEAVLLTNREAQR